MSRRGWVLFALMSVLWGIPYLMIKVAVEGGISVPVLVFARTALGAVLLLPLAIWSASGTGAVAALRRRWMAIVAFAAFEIIGPWALMADAERHLSSSLTGLLIAAVPIVGVVLALLVAAWNGRRRRGGTAPVTSPVSALDASSGSIPVPSSASSPASGNSSDPVRAAASDPARAAASNSAPPVSSDSVSGGASGSALGGVSDSVSGDASGSAPGGVSDSGSAAASDSGRSRASASGEGAERLGVGRWAGLLLGLVGVAVLAWPHLGGGSAWAVGEIMLVVLGYSIAPMIAARRLGDVPSLPLTAACLTLAALVYAGPAAATWPDERPAGTVLAALAGLGVACTALAFLVFFELIREVGTSRAMVFTYVNPAVAVLAGVVFLSEPLTATMLGAFVLILGGSVLATSRRRNTADDEPGAPVPGPVLDGTSALNDVNAAPASDPVVDAALIPESVSTSASTPLGDATVPHSAPPKAERNSGSETASGSASVPDGDGPA